MQKAIIINETGIAGLSAGCYGQMKGYKPQIFEMYTILGRLCTTWQRKGYKIDGCIHSLNNARPENSCYRFWEELGGVRGRDLSNNRLDTVPA